MKSLGIMGGTFDPIHYGHLVTAEGARVQFGLDRVWFVPSGHPPHKPAALVTPAKDRYEMTVLATVTNPFFEVSRIDIDRPGPTFTVDTLRLLQRELGQEVALYFITGADAILEILTWKDPDELLAMCQIIAASRPGFSLGKLESALGELYAKHSSRIHLLQVPAMAISSTDIRARVGEDRPIRYLVPETVMHYVYKQGLYRGRGTG